MTNTNSILIQTLCKTTAHVLCADTRLRRKKNGTSLRVYLVHINSYVHNCVRIHHGFDGHDVCTDIRVSLGLHKNELYTVR